MIMKSVVALFLLGISLTAALTRQCSVPSQRAWPSSPQRSAPCRGGLPLLQAESAESRMRAALPSGDEIDRRIFSVAVPSIANLAVAQLVGEVDTFWVGRMGDALALAGQGAANTCFFCVYFLVAFIPTITAPLVAKSAGEGDMDMDRAAGGLTVCWLTVDLPFERLWFLGLC